MAVNAYSKVFLPLVDTVVFYSSRQKSFSDTSRASKLVAYVNTILEQLKGIPSVNSFWLLAIENLRSTCQHLLLRSSKSFGDTFIERDRQMAANLAWLFRVKYPKEKIIVWAANGHVSKNAVDAIEPKEFRHPSLGYYFTQQKEFAETTYVLGFTSYQGTAGRTTYQNSIYGFSTPKSEGFEQWVYRENRKYAFVDFKPFAIANPQLYAKFYLNGESHFPQKGIWTKCFDGVFYLKDMYPCKKTNH